MVFQAIWKYLFPSSGDSPLDLATLKTWEPTRVLSETGASAHSAGQISTFLLGKLRGQDAIVHLQRTSITADTANELVTGGFGSLNVFLENRPYFSAHAWLARPWTGTTPPDVQVKVICPATATHIKKYAKQERVMLRETPELYRDVVVPYIESFPPDRLDWVYNILDGKKEAERVLYNDTDPEIGFTLIPDLKWDQTSMSALYLSVLVRTRTIRTLRDLKKHHLPLLNAIQTETRRVVQEKFGVAGNKIRLFVHYQPSYYHFHVHVVHIDHECLAGLMVGQAHMLDDLISLVSLRTMIPQDAAANAQLELSPEAPEPTLLERATFTYAIGVEHGLYAGFVTHGLAS